jgi:hypothetical protein
MDNVAKASSEALRTLIEATQDTDRARIAESYPRAFAEFEKMAQAFRSRAGKIADRLVAIQSGITEGRILVAVDVFDQSTTRDRVDFMKVLTPKAQETYRKMSPAKFSSLDFYLQKFGMRFSKAVNDACFPDANAIIAGTCVALCASTAGAACVECVAAVVVAGGTASYLYFKNGYESCLRGCCGCRWYRPWCCGCKAGCFSLGQPSLPNVFRKSVWRVPIKRVYARLLRARGRRRAVSARCGSASHASPSI